MICQLKKETKNWRKIIIKDCPTSTKQQTYIQSYRSRGNIQKQSLGKTEGKEFDKKEKNKIKQPCIPSSRNTWLSVELKQDDFL